jgi:N-acetylglucosaminyldiphosphoundecaprenol N-acetyl-beta-D-mannosaminyltransferase
LSGNHAGAAAPAFGGLRQGAGGELPVVSLRGVPIHAVREEDCVAHIHRALDRARGGWVVTPNLDFLRRLDYDRAFADLFSQTTLVVADGMPLVWAARIQGTPLPQRVAGSDLILSVSREAGRRGRSVFLLGGAAGVAPRAAAVLAERCPGLRIAGWACPRLNGQIEPSVIQDLAEQLQRTRPDIIFVALGSPKQEQVIEALRPYLPGAWWMGVGISLSFLCGHIRRAPRWMQRSGLEWVHRLIQEPRRLAGRYLWKGLVFALVLFTTAAWARVRPPRARVAFNRLRTGVKG